MRLLMMLVLVISCQQDNDLKNTNITADNTQSTIDERTQPTEQQPLPKCESICFKDYRTLKGKNNDKDFLAFKNFGYRGIGRCRGHAIVNQKVYELSNFRPDLKLNCNQLYLTKQCRKLIQSRLNNIMNFQVANFPGFKNLYELSNHPEVKEILRSYVRSISHRYKAGQADIRDQDLFDSKLEAIFNELLMRVKENQRPYVGIKGNGIGHHALIVHSYKYSNSQLHLCVHDSNIIFHQRHDQCENYLYLKAGQVYYQRINQPVSVLSIFSLTSDEDRRVAKYIKARYNHCIKSNRANNQCR